VATRSWRSLCRDSEVRDSAGRAVTGRRSSAARWGRGRTKSRLSPPLTQTPTQTRPEPAPATRPAAGGTTPGPETGGAGRQGHRTPPERRTQTGDTRTGAEPTPAHPPPIAFVGIIPRYLSSRPRTLRTPASRPQPRSHPPSLPQPEPAAHAGAPRAPAAAPASAASASSASGRGLGPAPPPGVSRVPAVPRFRPCLPRQRAAAKGERREPRTAAKQGTARGTAPGGRDRAGRTDGGRRRGTRGAGVGGRLGLRQARRPGSELRAGRGRPHLTPPTFCCGGWMPDGRWLGGAGQRQSGVGGECADDAGA
jgi:hypothetical protein